MRRWPWVLLLVLTILGSAAIGTQTDVHTGLSVGVSALLLLGLTRVLWSPPASNSNRSRTDPTQYF